MCPVFVCSLTVYNRSRLYSFARPHRSLSHSLPAGVLPSPAIDHWVPVLEEDINASAFSSSGGDPGEKERHHWSGLHVALQAGVVEGIQGVCDYQILLGWERKRKRKNVLGVIPTNPTQAIV